MLEDVLNELDRFIYFGSQFDTMNIDSAIRSNAKYLAESRIRDYMLKMAEEAINTIEEFQYPPLEERLMENLLNWEHYYVSPDLRGAKVFNEQIAGMPSDILEGQIAGGGPGTGTPEQNLFVWMFGIYKPAREGGPRAFVTKKNKSVSFEELPTYEEVIKARLDAWGTKAPYWIFLEYGNASGAPAYPSFAGTGFISKVRAEVPAIVSEALDDVAEDMVHSIEDAVGFQFENPNESVPVVLDQVRYESPGPSVHVEARTSKTGIWFMLKVRGRYVGRIRPGERLPTGEIFSP